jgi:hypothetical protein
MHLALYHLRRTQHPPAHFNSGCINAKGKAAIVHVVRQHLSTALPTGTSHKFSIPDQQCSMLI